MIQTRSTQQQMATGATVLKEAQDGAQAPASTHARLRTVGRLRADRPVVCPRTHTPPSLSPHVILLRPLLDLLQPHLVSHNAGPCCLETRVDTRHPCAPRAHTANSPYSYHTHRRRSISYHSRVRKPAFPGTAAERELSLQQGHGQCTCHGIGRLIS